MNYLLWNAAHFNKHNHIVQLLLECTVTDIKIDMNTYIKLFTSLYFDIDIKYDRKEFLTYLYLLYSNDHNTEVFKFGTELFDEYIESNI